MMYALIPLCLGLAAVFLWQESKKNYVPAVALKGAASLCFVIMGLLLSDGSRMAKLICAGLILGCIADVLLNLRYVFEKKGQLVFLAGIAVFLSGHILYLIAVFAGVKYWWLCVLIGAVLTALLDRVYRRDRTAELCGGRETDRFAFRFHGGIRARVRTVPGQRHRPDPEHVRQGNEAEPEVYEHRPLLRRTDPYRAESAVSEGMTGRRK